MTTFTMIILVLFVCIQTIKFIVALELENYHMAILFGGELVMFAYLAKVLM